MAGSIKTNSVTLGDSATDSQNFQLRTNVDGTAKLARGAAGNLGDILTVDVSGKVSLAGLDLNQTWQNVLTTPGRASGVTYTNTTSKPIKVFASFFSSANGACSATPTVGGVNIGIVDTPAIGFRSYVSFEVTPGTTYSILLSNGVPMFQQWSELR